MRYILFLILLLLFVPVTHASTLDTLLVKAAASGSTTVARKALQLGANVNTVVHDGTALWWATEKNNPEMVQLLLDVKAQTEISRYGITPLMESVRMGHNEILDLLLRANANPNVQEEFGKTPLMYAADKGDTTVIAALLKAGADVGLTGTKGWHALMHAAYGGHLFAVTQLLQNKAALEQKDQYGKTVLLWAVERNHLDVVRALIKAGAQVEVMDANGKTAIDYAEDKPEILKLLTGADKK